MEVNKEEAIRCLSIAQRHRSASNLPSALKFARKSVALYSTPEGEALVFLVEREIATGGSSSSSTNANPKAGSTSPPTPGTPGPSSARATGVEEHLTSARERTAAAGKAAGASASTAPEPPKKREYTVKQLEVVTRVKRCKHHEYYEILAVERKCTENDVKKAYKKLALALHPDKNGAPGADEAFKMVSKAFQVLSDSNMRAAFDSNPTIDPTQRGAAGMSRSSGGGGMHPGFGGGGFQGDLNPEDLFNMFFGGGGLNGGFGGGGFGQSPFGGARVYTFGGGAPRRRPAAGAAGAQAEGPTSPMVALLPVLILVIFVLFSLIPSLFSGPFVPDPEFAFQPSTKYNLPRTTWHRGVQYHVNKAEWEGSAIWQTVPEPKRERSDAALFSTKVRQFERTVEEVKIRQLQTECHTFNAVKQRQISEEAGVFGWGADYDKIRKLRAEKHPSCEQLRSWGMTQQQGF